MKEDGQAGYFAPVQAEDPSYTPVWMPLADALVAADELDLARDLYEQIAASSTFDARPSVRQPPR